MLALPVLLLANIADWPKTVLASGRPGAGWIIIAELSLPRVTRIETSVGKISKRDPQPATSHRCRLGSVPSRL